MLERRRDFPVTFQRTRRAQTPAPRTQIMQARLAAVDRPRLQITMLWSRGLQERVIVRAQDEKGTEFEADLTELAARCVLHETDHCDGIVFTDRMTPLKRQYAKRKIKTLQQTGEWV